jgi:hypothetical protein
MRGHLFLLLVIISLPALANRIEIKGTYQGENLYIKNPFAATGVGFCVYEVTVNGMTTTDEINSSAFEVDLTVYGFRVGESVSVAINYKEGCVPVVLNPDILNARATFEIEELSIDGGNITWKTKNESGSLPYIIEQFRWNKWVVVGQVTGKGSQGTNSYSATVRIHSGENRFRIRQTDSRKNNRFSSELVYKSSKKPLTFAIDGNTIRFTEPTMYEVYDGYGRIVVKGYGAVLQIASYERGRYYINYDNRTELITKR